MSDHNHIDKILEGLENSGFAVIENLFTDEQLEPLKNYFEKHITTTNFHKAAIGKNSSHKIQEAIRGDYIHWIQNWTIEPVLKKYHAFLETLILPLREQLYLPIKSIEGQLAHYPPGAKYSKHLDQHKGSPHRLISTLLYISPWKKGFGGELVLHHQQAPVIINPTSGKFVCFLSKDIPHEVRQSLYHRFSITAWLRDDLSFISSLDEER